MAITNLKEWLQDLANAIKEKLDSNEPINAQEFANIIRAFNVVSQYIKYKTGQTVIYEEQYANCLDAETIVPSTITEIQARAFLDCVNLAKVTISNNSTTIGDGIFKGCTALEELTMPDCGLLAELFGGTDNSTDVPSNFSKLKLTNFRYDDTLNNLIKNFNNCTSLKELILNRPPGLDIAETINNNLLKDLNIAENAKIELPSFARLSNSAAASNSPFNLEEYAEAMFYKTPQQLIESEYKDICGEIGAPTNFIDELRFQKISAVPPETYLIIGGFGYCTKIGSLIIPVADNVPTIVTGFRQGISLREIVIGGTIESFPYNCFERMKGTHTLVFTGYPGLFHKYAFGDGGLVGFGLNYLTTRPVIIYIMQGDMDMVDCGSLAEWAHNSEDSDNGFWIVFGDNAGDLSWEEDTFIIDSDNEEIPDGEYLLDYCIYGKDKFNEMFPEFSGMLDKYDEYLEG